MIRYIIVDDEPLAHELIEEFCGMLPHLELAKNCYNALEAMQYLNEQTVDIIFLDLNMPKLKGFDFLRTLTHPPQVIVTTAYQEFALEGYELNVADYLLKPFSFDRLVKAINKAVGPKQEGSISNTLSTSSNERFFIKGDKKYHQIAIDDILFIEAYGNYTKLHLRAEVIISHEKISEYESSLSNELFIRVHKSFMVAKDKINLIEGNRIKIQNHEIPVGQTYRAIINRLYL
ncbi:MAG: LytTR family DNA-binding domain-containing protein [Reichenbachiella sp.]|uniref:LytR/AlgR family response regulator transcription factor n=1 Tax=Reichenbachiella sp. TaxID=2184521 RepID=UPI00296699EC|nr:LytTR family DNA-binding domain-containing protein [Reichenbachiella sp.]MDW3208425.1 LytTR family DNA-binding domain-containing protein [Reichenbachiella sp.]